MSDKTRLELDLELHERNRTPVSVKTLIIMLAISLCFLGAYTFNLKRKLAEIEREAIVMKENYQQEKSALLRQIEQLQARHMTSEPDVN